MKWQLLPAALSASDNMHLELILKPHQWLVYVATASAPLASE